nr:MAG TPA: hypothetical protein [Bacteriophage sp.]
MSCPARGDVMRSLISKPRRRLDSIQPFELRIFRKSTAWTSPRLQPWGS